MIDSRGIGRRSASARDGDPLTAAIETLAVVESRIAGIEAKVAVCGALALPPPPKRRIRESQDASFQALQASLVVGALVRRINLRLGAIERALEHRPPLDLEQSIPLRSPRRLKALEAALREAEELAALRRSGAGRNNGRGQPN